MTHVRKIGVITTCGAPYWRLLIMGQPGRRTVLRGIRALCAWRCRTMYVATYLMDTSSPEKRKAFIDKVQRKVEAF